MAEFLETDGIRDAIIRRASELATQDFVAYGSVNMTNCVERATADIKKAADEYLKLLGQLRVNLSNKL